MGTWSKRVILICGLVAVGCAGKAGDADAPVASADVGDTLAVDQRLSDEPDAKVEEVAPEQRVPDCLLPSGEPAQCGGGPDGTACGKCPENHICHDGICECVPQCEGKEEGPDGCGDECGDGWRPPEPNCWGKECGPDGAGGNCGECTGGGEVCELSTGTCAAIGPDCGGLMVGYGQAQRMTALTLSFQATPGGGLDLDGNPETCAPAGHCTGGVDNALAALEPVIFQVLPGPDFLMTSLSEKGWFPLLTQQDWKWDLSGKESGLGAGLGKALPESEKCDWLVDECSCCVVEDSIDPYTCFFWMSLDNAAVVDGTLSAGSPDAVFHIDIPLEKGLALPVTGNLLTIRAQVVPGEDGGFHLEDGLIGFAVRFDKMMESIDCVPDGVMTVEEKAALKEALGTLVVPDMDTDDDGEKDAISMAFRFSTLPGTSVGLCPDW